MNTSLLNQSIARARAAVNGDFVSTARVVDHLLDLRNLAGSDEALVELIDRSLASIPGRSVAGNAWWLATLDTIERLATSADDPSPMPA